MSQIPQQLVNEVSEVISTDIKVAQSSFKLLESVNSAALEQVSQLTHLGDDLTTTVTHLHEKYQECIPVFEKIDIIDQKVAELEKVVHLLDQYSKKLEQRVKKL
ncbi:hypothetical protein RCL1_004778 [Eukaryota sp. TZLM3-RCL]